MKKIAIIGGGASGLAAATAASEHAARTGKEVVVSIYEASDRVGRPILATGNGRCNFSNACIDPDVYRNPAFVSNVLGCFEEAFPKGVMPNGVVAFFEAHGMLHRQEGEGRLYPLANKASVVLDVLRSSYSRHGAAEIVDSRAKTVEPPREGGSQFTVRMADGVFRRADAVVVACGGKVATSLLPEVLPFTPQRPVLCSIATKTEYVRELDNIRAKCRLSLLRGASVVASEHGEAMFRKYGVSGICAFNLSRFAKPGDVLSVDFLPSVTGQEAAAFIDARAEALCKSFGAPISCGDFLRGMVLPRVADVILKSEGLFEDDEYSHQAGERLLKALKGFRLPVEGPGDVEHAQVTRGGFDPSSFDPGSMEARLTPGLYVTGEALDVDAPCGGYNLHWAFATGLLAGRAAVS